ncbi:Stromal interaction molecule 1 [Geodia barretti]|uniref:Stromal interaction molecule 1 n=2 Tax=Geodia barretti TaxID=519541 RepID=A0AA35X046_GEOBA|nr:Stromal interaction molecule 1 [Geodia barretti]
MELKDNTEKSHRFHETDSQITSEDLWLSWQQNEVFHWTSAEVVHWLTVYVELPQYGDVFYKLNVTGRHLPRLANNTRGMLQSLLGVTDSQHKQKLRLRAMDLVLFGPPNGKYSLWKDVVVALSVSLCVVGVAYALRQRRVTQQRIDTFLESFREKERELRALHEKLEEQKEGCDETDGGRRGREETGGEEGDSSPAKSFPGSSPSPESEASLPPFSRNSSASTSFDGSLARAQEEIVLLRRELNDLGSQLASNTLSRSLLQSLLQDSCRYEREHVEKRRREAQDEITRAQRVCDKIKKRRTSLFGTFHLANSSALEEAGLQITRAVNNMQKVSESFEEYHQRWRRIEQVCNFPHHLCVGWPRRDGLPSPLILNPSRHLQPLPQEPRAAELHRRSPLAPRQLLSSLGRLRSSETNSFSFGDSPSASLRRGRYCTTGGGGSLERDCAHSASSSAIYNHQGSCPAFSSNLPRGRTHTLPPTSSLPRNFTVSGRLVSRHDSYNAAVEGENSCPGDVLANDRGMRKRMSESGIEKTATRRGSRDGGGRRGSIKRQSAVGLSAVHEEEMFGSSDSKEGAGPVAISTTGGVRGGVTGTSAHSTV